MRVLGEDHADELLGRSWSRVYADAKGAYGELRMNALERGDEVSAAAAAAFSAVLHEANAAMMQRHRLLHSVWTADSEHVTKDGASFSFRRAGGRNSGDWSLQELWALVGRINDLHQQSLAELARLIAK